MSEAYRLVQEMKVEAEDLKQELGASAREPLQQIISLADIAATAPKRVHGKPHEVDNFMAANAYQQVMQLLGAAREAKSASALNFITHYAIALQRLI